MKRKTRTLIGAAAGMLVLILDTKTAITGAQEGLRLCLTAVIPSLLPFFFLSILLTDSLSGTSPRFLRFMSRILRIPQGSESLFLTGVLGGYPTGAVCVEKAHHDGLLHRQDAERMLGFCSNAGPAFIFGIVGSAFSQKVAPWALWAIHLIGAITAAILLPGGSTERTTFPDRKPIPLSRALRQSVSIMSGVCGWIILFRLLLAIFDRWFLWYFETPVQILVSGIMELTIGCTELQNIQNEGLRFILCTAMLSFGGACITMQTVSAVETLGLGMYLPGKLIQCGASTFLAALLQQTLFPVDQRVVLSPIFYLIIAIALGLFGMVLKIYEKKSSNSLAIGV